jgi:hypothetical protein
MTVADNNGTQDWAADYVGEGGERAVNSNGIIARTPGRERDKIKKSSLSNKTIFSNTVCPGFRFICLILYLLTSCQGM